MSDSTITPTHRLPRIAIATIARSALLAVLVLLFAAAAPALIGWTPTTVTSDAMSPQIAAGDVVIARPVAEWTLRPGQTLVYALPTDPAHERVGRFVSAAPDGSLVMRGDVAAAREVTIPGTAVAGVAVARVPLIGLPYAWAASGNWFANALAAAALAAILLASTADRALRRHVNTVDDDFVDDALFGGDLDPSTDDAPVFRRAVPVEQRAATGHRRLVDRQSPRTVA